MTEKKLARNVAVVGTGMSKFGTFRELTSRDLFVEAFQEMKSTLDFPLDTNRIESFYLGNFSSDQFEKQTHLAPIAANWVGLSPIASTRVEDACASGAAAIRQAVLAIASGLYDVVLVGGLEKMSDLPITEVTEALATAADTLYEIPAGFTFPGFYAAMATAYMNEFGAPEEVFARVGIKNHENGALNEKAQFGQSIPDIMAAKKASAVKKGRPEPAWENEMDFLTDPRGNPMIAWPMRLFDCSPVSDGAAVALLVAEEFAAEFNKNPLHIIGTGQASDGALTERSTLSHIPAAAEAARQAYEMAGIGPEDINLAEVHDCFTIAEIMATEDLGFFAPGEGWKAVLEGKTTRTGERPINTSGGLKSKGHPVGASGVGQLVEIWKQLRGTAGERQVPGSPRIGLTHNVGGSGQTCVVHIYERRG